MDTPLLKLATRHDDEAPKVQFGSGLFHLEPLEETILLGILLRAKRKELESLLRRTHVNRFVIESGMQCLRTDEQSLYDIVQRKQNWTELMQHRESGRLVYPQAAEDAFIELSLIHI